MAWIGLAAACAARADTFTGGTWAVRYNRPDQTTSAGSAGPEEYALREAWLARIDALESNDWACLSTFTFSGNSAAGGAAGPILAAVSNALARGARVGFVVDKGVDPASNFWPGVSLKSLAARPGNKLQLAQSPAAGGIMHHKMGVFWHRGAGKAWVVSGSWNMTGGASSQQWNVLTEIQNNALGAACSNELRELLSGRFQAHPDKSHAHDGTRFRLEGTARDGWVRFAPYPDGRYGGTNALTDVVAAIDAAEDEIYFALNKVTREGVADALIRACDRGVTVHGTIPKSDRTLPGQDSYEVYRKLRDAKNYATRNRVRLYDAYYDAARSRYDNGSRDLVHAKYMVVDPRGANPLAMHGSANWTASGLVLTASNDENVQFLPHRGIAQALAAQFAAMTDGMKPWCSLRGAGTSASAWLDYWLPDDGAYELEWSEKIGDGAAWNRGAATLPVGRGTNAAPVLVERPASRRFYRIRGVGPGESR